VAELQAKGMQMNDDRPGRTEARMRDIVKPVTRSSPPATTPRSVKLYNDELARIRK
jgi:hypothetical protein